MRVIILLTLASFSISCLHMKFPDSPDLDKPSQALPVEREVSAEGNGFIWDSCSKVSTKAVSELKSQLDEDEKLIGIKYLNYETGQYSDASNCVKETGWVWAVYTFWWPSATKVGIKGTVVSYSSNVAQSHSSEEPGKKISVTKGESLTIVGYDLSKKVGKYERKYVTLKLSLRNDGHKRITAYNLKVNLSTKLGDKKEPFSLTSNSSSIEPGASESAQFTWKDNQFIDNEVYDWLASISTENLVVKMRDQKLVEVSVGH